MTGDSLEAQDVMLESQKSATSSVRKSRSSGLLTTQNSSFKTQSFALALRITGESIEPDLLLA